MNEELKPCPFCGKIPKIIISKNSNSKDFYSVECKRMSCTFLVSTFAYRTEKEAIEAWNRRSK